MVLEVTGGKIKAEKRLLKNMQEKTHYYSISAADWTSEQPDVDDMEINSAQLIIHANINILGRLHLPHGSVIVSAIVYGSDTTETWNLVRNDVAAATNTPIIGATAYGTSAKPSTEALGTINNKIYTYTVGSSQLETGDIVYGGVIEYKLPIDIEDPKLTFE